MRDIIGNTICADLLDYLHRDHLFSGLPFAVGERYMAYFYVTPVTGEVHYPARMVLRIQRDGHERPDVVTELLKHLRYRYELSERALVHHAKLAAYVMIGKALEMWTDALWRDLALDEVGPESDLRTESDITALRERFVAERSEEAAGRISDRMQGRIEAELARRGDDSFLEWLRDETAAEGGKPDDDVNKDRRKAAVHALSTGDPQSKALQAVSRCGGRRTDRSGGLPQALWRQGPAAAIGARRSQLRGRCSLVEGAYMDPSAHNAPESRGRPW